MNENKIRGLFYKINVDEIEQYVQELESFEYFLDFKTIDTLNLLKSEILKNSWKIILCDCGSEKKEAEEIVDFINDTNRAIRVIIISESIDKSLLKLSLKESKIDLVTKDRTSQVAYSIIKCYQKTITLNQSEFAQKEIIRLQKTQTEHDNFLNQVIESTSNPIFYKGTEGRYFGCNTAFANFIGLPKDEIIGKTVFEVAPQEFAQKYYEMDQEFFENPVTQRYEYKVADSKGEIMDVIFFKTAIRDDNGNVVGLLGHMFDISDRKKLETELKKEKEIAEFILDTSSMLYVTLDLDGVVTSVNKRACTVIELNKNNIVGKSWLEHFVPEERKDAVEKTFRDILNESVDISNKIEGKVLTATKKVIDVLWENSLIKDDDGKVIGILSSGKEIIEENRLAKELALSENKYRTLVENMHEGLGIVDLNEKIIFSNPAFDRMFGLDVGEMLGRDIREFVKKEDLDKIQHETSLRMSDQKSQYKVTIVRKDGKERVINISSVPWKNENNEIVGALGMIMDITTEHYFNKKLERKVEIEQSIVKISSQFISVENFDKKLNYALRELYNIIEAERYGLLVVKNNKILLSTEQHYYNSSKHGIDFEDIEYDKFEYALKMLESLDFIFIDDVNNLPDEAKVEREIFAKHKIFNFLGIPFYSESRLAGLLSISNIYDVNEWTIEELALLRTVADIIGHAYNRKIAEDKAQQLKQDLITKNKELEQVVYVTSHDIRSPVVNILGFSDEMIKALNKLTNKVFDEANTIHNREDIEYLVNKDIPQIMNFIKISGQKIDKLLLALLKLSRLGRASINKVKVNMNELMNSLLSTFEYRIKEHDIDIQIEPLMNCYTDEVQINQVISNLIDNAIKYRSNTRKPIIKITSQENGEHITYCIEDNGIGISEKELDKVFDVFYRINPENQDGEGMGLALIKKTIERLDGDISVGSKVGEGTKFYISLEKQEH